MRRTVDEEGREIGPHFSIKIAKNVELQPIGEGHATPFYVCLRNPLADQLVQRRSDSVYLQAMTDQKSDERDEFARAQNNALGVLLDQSGHRGLEHLDLARDCRFVTAPGVRKIKRVRTRQGTCIHAPEIHHRLADRLQTMPNVRMISLGAVRQVEDFMLTVGQPGMNRVPLNPWFEILWVGYIGDRRKHLGRAMEFGEARKLAFAHPFVNEGRANLVEFQQEDPSHRASPKLPSEFVSYPATR